MKNCPSVIVRGLVLAGAAVIVQACDVTRLGPASTRPPIAASTDPRIQQTEKSAQPNRLSGSDWSSIRQEHLRRQQAAFPVDGGWRARNYQQNWSTFFDGRGFEITPDDGSWRWGLKLTAYGYQGRERRVDTPKAAADVEKFSYQWDSILREWYVNGENVEHGYTVAARPGLGAGLRFRLDVLGTLEPRVAPDGRSITFVEREGAARVINYSGLKVTDAAGRELAARFWNEGSGLRLEIDDTDAQYPITVDPIVQLAYVKASNADAGDGFGYSVAVDGNLAVVGAPYERGKGTSPSDNSLISAGAAYIFWRTPSGAWIEVSYLKAPNADASDYFGYSVGVGHNSFGDARVVVGAWGEDGPRDAGLVNPSSNVSHDSGAAYVFKLIPTLCGITPLVCPPVDWPLEQYLKGQYLRPDDHFSIVAISGDTIVVGAFNDDDFNEGDPDVGAAYVFTIDSAVIGAVWTQEAYLKPPCFCPGHQFGLSVGVSEDEQTVIVGAWKDSITTRSKAYVFTRAGTVWNFEATLQPPNQTANTSFGFSVGISDDTAVVGAPATAFDNGRAYVFKRSLQGPPPWTLEGTLIPAPSSRAFGWSVAISGDTAIVGAPFSTLTGTGYGELYLFTRPPLGSVWSQQDHFQTSNFQDGFGSSVALSGSTVVVGAFEDSGNSLFRSGAAYVFGPPVTLTSISISAPKTTVLLGASEQFTADGTYSDGTHADLTNQVTWNSSTSAVTITATGVATGAAAGPSDITASMSGVVSNRLTLTVTTLTTILISAPKTALLPGTSEQFTAIGTYSDGSRANLTNQVTWNSSSIAVTIRADGLSKGEALGSSDITASMSGVVSNTFTLKVTATVLTEILIDYPNSFLSGGRVNLTVGESEQFTARGYYSDGSFADLTNQAIWHSSNSVVTISGTGLATSAGVGAVEITASMSDVTSNAVIVVVRSFTIVISAPYDTMSVGSFVPLTATAHYSDNTTANITNQVTWNSSSSAVTISAAGVATGAGGGYSLISASMSGVISGAYFQLHVLQGETTTQVSASVKSISRGQTITFTAFVSCRFCFAVPKGQVVFKDFGMSLPAGTSMLVNGQATLDVTTLSIGSHSITATFIENADFFGSRSTPVEILVVGASGLDESSGTAARAILTGSVRGHPIDSEDKISGNFGSSASAQTSNVVNVGYSSAYARLSPVDTHDGSHSFGPSVGAYTRADGDPNCVRGCTRGAGAGRAISYARYRNDTLSAQAFQVSGIIDGGFYPISNSISPSGHITAMVYVFDQDDFLNAIETSGQSMSQFLLGRDTIDDYATANASTLPLTRLFPSVKATSEFQVLTRNSTGLPLRTSFSWVDPGHSVIVVLDISTFQPAGGIVDFYTTLKPAPVFLTDPAGNPSPMTAVGPWAPAPPPLSISR